MTAAAAERAAQLHAEGHAATANMRPVRGAKLLRAALRQLDRVPADPQTDELRGRILVILAYAEAEQGGIDGAWQLLDQAEALLPAAHRALAYSQRALLCTRTGRDEEAIAQYGNALALIREETGARELARALLNRGNLQMFRGRLREARADLQRCAEVSARHGLVRIEPMARHSLGYAAFLAGDLPTALRTYRAVADQYTRVKPGILPVLALDRARALTTAGLLAEADEQLAYALGEFARHRLGQDHAEALLARAENALSAGVAPAALRWATAARRGFLRRDNQRWAAVAALVALRARAARPANRAGSARLAAEADGLAEELRALGLREHARQAALIAARARVAAGLPAAADTVLGRPPPRSDTLETHLLWRLTRAERATADGLSTQSVRELAAGMAALHRRRSQLGSFDLQAGAAVHGRAIAAAGLATALQAGSLAAVHRWSELSRAQALLLPPATPPEDPAAAAALEELRRVRDGVRTAELAGRPAADLRARAARLERAVREHSWTAAGTGDPTRPAPLAAVRAAVGEAALVSFLRSGGRLHALAVTARRTRLIPLGDFAEAEESVRRLRADLDARAGRALPARLAAAIAAATRRDGAAVAAALIEPLLSVIGDRELVVVPTATLVTVPWSVLPGCAGRPVTVAPSATTWLAARGRLAARDEGRPAVLVAGPGNDRGETEVCAIARLHPLATVLIGQAATPAATATALGKAGLAHIAAHGHHQQENALFSRLDLAGGPLMGYDLHRLDAAPTLVVLAACDVGLADVRPGDETIGLTVALLSAGTSTVVAGVTRIADESAIDVMTRFHGALRAGRPAAVALAAAGPEAAGLVCFGAG